MVILTDQGVFADSKPAILNFVTTRYEEIYGRKIDRSFGSAIFMYLRTGSDRFLENEQDLEDFSHFQSIQEAIGFFLDMFGLLLGNERKGASKAVGSIRVTGKSVGSPAGDIIEGSAFGTATGKRFFTTEDAYLPVRIAVFHQEDNIDSIPSPYSTIEASKIASVSRYADGTGVFPQGSPGWEVSGTDEITWNGGTPDTPLTNQIYYVNLVFEAEIDVDISVVAELPGTSYNTTADSITEVQAGVPAILSVTNPDEITNATDKESDADYRNRLLGSSFTDWTVAKMRSEILKVMGVRATQIVEFEGVDQYEPDNWTGIGDTPFKILDSTVEYAQLYRPQERVLGLSALTLRVKAVKALSNEPIYIKLYVWKGDYATTISFPAISSQTFSSTDLDYDEMLLGNFQNVRIPLKYAGLDRTFRYLIRIHSDTDPVDPWHIVFNATPDRQFLGLFTDGIINTDEAFAFKTHFVGNGYTAYVATETGYAFGDVEDEIDELLEDFTPVSTERIIEAADTVDINIYSKLTLAEGYELKDVAPDIETAHLNYINNLSAGAKVIYAKIGQIIMGVQGIVNYKDLKISRSTTDPIPPEEWLTTDIFIARTEVAVLGTPGTTFDV